MVFFRLVFGLLLAASMLCFAMYAGTGQVAWRKRGVGVLKWTLIAALAFFAVLIAQRVARLL